MAQLDIRQINDLHYYDGEDLGCTVTTDYTTFKVWSPLADSIEICIYENYKDINKKVYSMTKKEKGLWEITFKENLQGKYYTFLSTIDNNTKEGVDPYAKALSVNGERAAIVNMTETNPFGFINHKRPEKLYGTDSIIYEVSIRDISSDINSGISNKGKYLGITEDNTFSSNGTKTGLSHIKDLGITHIQLMPIYDFGSIDERLPQEEQYNWGYDPAHYNVPEGSYATDPYNPICRIKELKEAIQVLHENGINVIMDVVYNHMYDVLKSGFHKLMPGYYFRYNNGELSNESMCGNAIASENTMVRKFILDSVKYWVTEYQIDGFRFDLMGLIDIDTMNLIREELSKIDPNIIIIGEGWDMNSILPKDKKAIQRNAYKMKNIGFFNDVARDGIRGNAFWLHDKGFINGSHNKEIDIKKTIVGGIKYSEEINTWGDVNPNQVINYVECHDNHTLYDRLKLTISDENKLKYMHRLGTSIVLLSQGIPFIHSGQEFLRTKKGIDNTYNLNDEINKMDWLRKLENMDTVEYIKGLIKLRKEYLAFRMRSVEEIKSCLRFINSPANSVAYKLINLNNDDIKEIIVIHNANESNIEVNLDREEVIKVAVNKEEAGIEGINEIKSDKLVCEGLSTLVGLIV